MVTQIIDTADYQALMELRCSDCHSMPSQENCAGCEEDVVDQLIEWAREE